MTEQQQSIVYAFDDGTREAFANHVDGNPNTRRVTLQDREGLSEWLTSPGKHPATQEEFSRRNYIRKTFFWDPGDQALMAKPRKNDVHSRVVVTTNAIVDVVESVHCANKHAGWDSTWKDISTSYYGILRSDVIFLLKRCRVCVDHAMKRAMRSGTASAQNLTGLPDITNVEDLDYTNWISGNLPTSAPSIEKASQP